MAVFSTALPVWLIAESVRRMGANAASVVGALGPVFTIGMGAMILGEPINAIQLTGAALVLTGVLLILAYRRSGLALSSGVLGLLLLAYLALGSAPVGQPSGGSLSPVLGATPARAIAAWLVA